MGLYDRDYYREEPRGFNLGGDRSMVINLIIANAVIYLVDGLLLDHRLQNQLSLKADLLEKPWQAWQLLTYGFLHDNQPFHVIFNMIALWFFGRDVEGVYGKIEFLKFYFSFAAVAGFLWVVFEQLAGGTSASLVGASGAIAGVIVMFICHWPYRTILFWFFPLPAWVLGTIWLAQDVLGAMSPSRGAAAGPQVAYVAHLAGALCGYIYYRTRWHLFSIIPTRGFSFQNLFKRRPKLRVHKPDREASPDEDELTTKADAVLEKITLYGQSSLTPEECRILEAYSRRMQQKLR
jgi:membrane associated rhomboid family serine protease